MNKRRIRVSTIVLALLIVFSALRVSALASQTGASRTKYTNDFSKGTSEYTLFDLQLKVPDSWEYYLNAEKNCHEFLMNDGDIMLVQMFPALAVDSGESALEEHLKSNVFTGYVTDWIETDEYNSPAFRGTVADAGLISGGKNYNATCFTLTAVEGIYHIGVISRADARYDYNRDLVRIIENSIFPTSSTAGTDINWTSQAAAVVSQPTVQETQPPASEPAPAVGSNYVVNTNTRKFHVPGCRSVAQMKASNRWDYTGSRDWLISQGYEPCKNCNP